MSLYKFRLEMCAAPVPKPVAPMWSCSPAKHSGLVGMVGAVGLREVVGRVGRFLGQDRLGVRILRHRFPRANALIPTKRDRIQFVCRDP